MSNLHSATITLNHVGQTEWAGVFAGVEALLEARPELLTIPQTKVLLRNLDSIAQQTVDILQSVRVATFAESLSFMWARLPKAWEQREARLTLLWEPLVEQAKLYLSSYGAGPVEPPKSFVNVHMEPADADYVERVHYLSGLEPALRVMFIEADDPDTLYTADVLDEEAVSSILATYPVLHWKSPAAADLVGIGEFWVYVVRGKRIFRTDGLVASTDLDALRVLQSGEFLPRMASLRTASVIRMTFSMQAMLDPSFRDFLRDLGGVPASVVSWDVPIYEEKDVDNALDKVRENFGYPVHFYQIIDTPEQNIYASANPEGQVARMLSAQIESIESGEVEVPDMSDVYEKAAACLPVLDGAELHKMERVASACKVSRHYFVARVGEVKPQTNRFACDLGSLFTNPRTEGVAQAVRVFPGSTVTQIVASDVLKLDKNNDGTIDATEMGTLGLMSGSESADTVLDDHCAYGHCPECMAAGDHEDGDCIVCVDGHKCAASEWMMCDCGPLEGAKTASTEDMVTFIKYTMLPLTALDASFYESQVADSLGQLVELSKQLAARMHELPKQEQMRAVYVRDLAESSYQNMQTLFKAPDRERNAPPSEATRTGAKALKSIKGHLTTILKTLQTTTAASSVSMPAKDRDQINRDLRSHGLDGQLRFSKVGAALAQAASILNKYGYEIDDALSGHIFGKPEGTYSLDVAKSGEDPMAPIPVTNTGLFVQWNPYGDTQDASVIMYLG